MISKKKTPIELIEEYKNPYPKDIFIWDNETDMKITRGRFNEFAHSVVENIRNDLIKRLREEDEE